MINFFYLKRCFTSKKKYFVPYCCIVCGQPGREGPLDCKLSGSQSCKNPLARKLQTLLQNLYWLCQTCNVYTFLPLIIIERRGNFVYYYWVCGSINCQLSYPLISLVAKSKQIKVKVLYERKRKARKEMILSGSAQLQYLY